MTYLKPYPRPPAHAMPCVPLPSHCAPAITTKQSSVRIPYWGRKRQVCTRDAGSTRLLRLGVPAADEERRVPGAGEAGVRRLAKEMDSAASAVWELVSESIIQALELALFLLGELYGWAALQAPHSTLGLNVRRAPIISRL